MTGNDKRIRVAFMISNFRAGGAETQFWNLVRNLDRTRFEVHLILIESRGRKAEPDVAGEVPFLIVRARFQFDPSAIFQISSYLRDKDIDVIQSILFMDNQFARASGFFCRVPVVTSVRGELRPILGQTKTRVEYFMQSLSAKVVTNSHWLKSQLVDGGSDAGKVEVVYNGVDFAKLEPDVGGSRIRGYLNVADEDLLVGCVGRLHPMKDHSTFLEAFKLFSRTHPSAVAVIVGGGSEERSLKDRAGQLGLSDSVRFAGEIFSDMGSWYQAMDLMIFTSRWGESFPNVLLEAMHCGVPVVATDVSAVREIIDDGVNGYIAPIGDSDRLAELASSICANDERRETLVSNAKEKVSQFSLEKMVSKFESIYAGLSN